VASSAAAFGRARSARRALQAFQQGISSLAQESLLVERELRSLVDDGDGPVSVHASPARGQPSPAQLTSVALNAISGCALASPVAKACANEDMSMSSCSSISFAKGEVHLLGDACMQCF
jgi:hypothetical protein